MTSPQSSSSSSSTTTESNRGGSGEKRGEGGRRGRRRRRGGKGRSKDGRSNETASGEGGAKDSRGRNRGPNSGSPNSKSAESGERPSGRNSGADGRDSSGRSSKKKRKSSRSRRGSRGEGAASEAPAAASGRGKKRRPQKPRTKERRRRGSDDVAPPRKRGNVKMPEFDALDNFDDYFVFEDSEDFTRKPESQRPDTSARDAMGYEPPELFIDDDAAPDAPFPDGSLKPRRIRPDEELLGDAEEEEEEESVPEELAAVEAEVTVEDDIPGFDTFPLSPALLRAVERAGYDRPREIQRQTLPAVLEGRDVLGLAQTGTGKTCAFALPILERLLAENTPGPRVLVLAPTRELAIQIESEFRKLGKNTRLSSTLIYGGVSDKPQIQALRQKPEVIVACPGRLLDLMKQGYVDLNRVETFVLDEADHMFDMGFLPDIERIIYKLPGERQNLLFAATMPDEIRKLAENILSDPWTVELAHTAPAKTIDHALYPVVEAQKLPLLKHFLAQEDFSSAIIFTRTKYRAKRLAENLEKSGLPAVALQGNMSQVQRDRAMQGFRDGKFNVLVATDIVARGIDVASVSHVINFDVPNTPEAYTHRIGRTGRAERSGRAYTFVTMDDREIVHAIERRIGAEIAIELVDGFEEAFEPIRTGRKRGGGRRGGERGSRRGGDRGGRSGEGGRSKRRRPRRGSGSGGSGSGSSGGGESRRKPGGAGGGANSGGSNSGGSNSGASKSGDGRRRRKRGGRRRKPKSSS